MVYFSEQDVDTVVKQRKKAFMGLYIMVAVFVILSVGLVFWYRTLPYKSPTITTVKLIHYPITGVFVISLFLYLGLFFRRINKRYHYQDNMMKGIRETSVGTFLEYSEDIQDKDGVDFKSLVFIEWNKYKNDFFERKVLVFFDRPFPEIPLNAKVEYTTQSNTLIEFRILGENE